MKVKDLIERLKRLDPDAMVLIPYENHVGLYVEMASVLEDKVKPHSELDEVFVDDAYYKKHPNKGKAIKVVNID